MIPKALRHLIEEAYFYRTETAAELAAMFSQYPIAPRRLHARDIERIWQAARHKGRLVGSRDDWKRLLSA